MRKELSILRSKLSNELTSIKNIATSTSTERNNLSPRKMEDMQCSGIYDILNDSAISDLRNDLDSARKLPNNSDQKDKLLTDIQFKLAELLESK